MPKISNFLFKNWQICLVIGLAVFVFIAASAFNFVTQQPEFWYGKGHAFIKWSSPDETANYIFSKLYAEEHQLYFYEKYNSISKDIIRPRSIRSDDGVMKPMSFLGMPLIYGTIGSVLGYQVIPYLTPVLAALGVIFYYLLMKELFGRKIALISAVLLAFFPVYLYYSARSMFHNVPFCVFVIIGSYLILKGSDFSHESTGTEKVPNVFNRNYSLFIIRINLTFMLAGGFIGLAVATRTSEILWLLPIFGLILILNLKHYVQAFFFVIGVFIAILPVLYWNQILFNGPFNSGYAEMNQTIGTIQASGKALINSTFKGQISAMSASYNKIKDIIFYFGYHPNTSLLMFNQYFVKMFYWIFWPGILGLSLFMLRFWKLNRRKFVYLCSWLAASCILVLYYGSWEFHDNPNAAEQTIGNSYTRYWLPIYLGLLPFIGHLMLKLFSFKFISRQIKIGLVLLCLGLSSFYSANFLLFGSSEGLIQTYYKNSAARNEFSKVIQATPASAVLITRYHDKIFFPERKVIVGDCSDDNMLKEYAVLAKLMPVYYYNFSLGERDLRYLQDRRLPKFGLTIKKISLIDSDFTLYKVIQIDASK
jgi:hypothetical protein